MKRKLISQGSRSHGSVTVTLPADWVKRFGLSGGDEVDVEELGNSISVKTGKKFEGPKTINIEGRDYTITQLRRSIAEAYRAGADVIKVNYKDQTVYHEKSKRTIRFRDELGFIVSAELLGMEVEKITSDSLIIKQFSEASEVEFESALRKVFYLLQDQVDGSVEAISKHDMELSKSTWNADRTVNKFCNFCMRLLSRKNMFEVPKALRLYTLIAFLEMIGDVIYLAPLFMAQFKGKVDSEVIVQFRHVKDGIACIMRLIYENKHSEVTEIVKFRDDTLRLLTKKTDPLNLSILHYLYNGFDLMVNLQDMHSLISISKNV